MTCAKTNIVCDAVLPAYQSVGGQIARPRPPWRSLGLLLGLVGAGCGSFQGSDGTKVSSLVIEVKGDSMGGKVGSQPVGIDCGSVCATTFAVGQSLSLTVTPDSDHTFEGWDGDCTGTATTCTLTMDKGKTVGVTFRSKYVPVNLDVTLAGTGSGQVTSQPAGLQCSTGTCRVVFGKDTTVMLTAQPNTGSYFTGWGGACSGTSRTCQINLTAAAMATANFGKPASCEHLRADNPALPDGNYTLFVNADPAKPWGAYCVMTGQATALTYLPLTNVGPNQNFSQYTAGGGASGSDVRTNYTKVLFDPATLKIDTNDKRFATSNGGSLVHGSTTVTSMPFGVAMGCNSTANGLGNIDLTGTKFAVAAGELNLGGAGPSGTTTPAADGQAKALALTGGGFCGWNAMTGVADPFNSRGLPLSLVYIP